jgi:hypothetical protein
MGWERKDLNRQERARVSAYCRRVATDREDWDEAASPSPRHPEWMFPGENLNAVYRWVDSHCGQPWADVYSKLCSSWPKRTLAGYHIIEDHIKHEVQTHPIARYWSEPLWAGRWFVKEDGILRRNDDYGSRWKSKNRKRKAAYPEGKKWTQDKVAEWLGGKWVKEDYFGNPYRWMNDWRYIGPRVRQVGSKHFFIVEGRQGKKLSLDQVKTWKEIYPWVREKFESNLTK